MNGSEEVKALSNGTGVAAVSSHDTIKTILCQNCGKIVERTGYNQKRCAECAALPQFSSTPRVQKLRVDEKAKKDSADSKPSSKRVPDEKEIKQILARDLSENAIRVSLLFGLETAERLGVTPNKFYWESNGDSELAALYNFCARGRQIDGKERTYQEWLDFRYKAKTDLEFLANLIRPKTFYPAHKPIADFFVKKTPETFPVWPYSQEQVDAWFDGLDTVKERILLYPRGSRKSTIDNLDCVQWIINNPEVRILILTGEYKLAVAFIRELKSYFTLKQGAITDFQILFPEFCIEETDTGKEAEFYCPARRLDLKEPTAWANSIEASLAGWRPDIIKGDDIVTEENSGTPERREKIRTRFGLATELLAFHGFIDLIGTRYATGEEPDLYESRMRNAEPGSLIVLSKPAWTPKQGKERVRLQDLQAGDVDLLYPEKLTFPILRKKLLQSETQFRCQQLNEPVGDENNFKIHFSPEDLERQTKQPEYFGTHNGFHEVDRVLSVDTAFSQSKYADRSAIVFARIMRKENKPHLIVSDVIADRLKYTEVALNVVRMIQKHNPTKVVIEKNLAQYEALAREINRLASVMNVSLPYVFWKNSRASKDAKFQRIKSLEPLIAGSRQIWFVAAGWTDAFLQELQKLDDRWARNGSTSHTKDDMADALGQMVVTFFDASDDRTDEDFEEAKKASENAARMAMQYSRYFGSDTVVVPAEPLAPPPPTDPLSQARQKLFGNGLWR